MGLVHVSRRLDVDPQAAFALWADPHRWSTFVDGFGAIEHLDEGWPTGGSEVVWRSLPGGRGRVVERVVACERPSRLVTEVAEAALSGTQTVEFVENEDGGAVAAIALDYELPRGGPLRRLTDLLFIRRAEAESLERTLARFAAEARGQAEL